MTRVSAPMTYADITWDDVFGPPKKVWRARKEQERWAEPWPDCIEWHMGLSVYGYGYRRVNGIPVYADRFAWETVHGPIPDGLCVLHRCDNRRCYNVEHLFLGTRADNMHDMTAKGRHGLAVLSAEQVAEIIASDESNKALGERFGVSHGVIHYQRRKHGCTVRSKAS